MEDRVDIAEEARVLRGNLERAIPAGVEGTLRTPGSRQSPELVQLAVHLLELRGTITAPSPLLGLEVVQVKAHLFGVLCAMTAPLPLRTPELVQVEILPPGMLATMFAPGLQRKPERVQGTCHPLGLLGATIAPVPLTAPELAQVAALSLGVLGAVTAPGPFGDLLQMPTSAPAPQLQLVVTVPTGLGHLLGADSPGCLEAPLSLPWLLTPQRAPRGKQELHLGWAAIPELLLQLPEVKRSRTACLSRRTANPGPIPEPSRGATARGPTPGHLLWVQAPRWQSGPWSHLGSWPSTGLWGSSQCVWHRALPEHSRAAPTGPAHRQALPPWGPGPQVESAAVELCAPGVGLK